MNFPYSKQNGVFKYLYSKDRNSYWNKFSLFATKSEWNRPPKNAFDWNTAVYWTSGYDIKIGVYLSFCFVTDIVELIGYEMQTSGNNCRPVTWNVSVSNDNITWEHNQADAHPFSPSEIKYFEYTPGIYRCMKITPTSYLNYCRGYTMDINQIEIFGRFYTYTNNFTCRIVQCFKIHFMTCFFLMFLLK